MRYLIYLFCIVLLLSSCKNGDDVKSTQSGQLNFTFGAVTNKTGRINGAATPAAVLVSIEDSQGNAIEENKKIALTAFGDGYISESLKLNQGDYKLTLFVITDADGKAIYATPLEGSDFANQVNDPLPISFNINPGKPLTLSAQVVAIAESDTPQNFGYVNFTFEVVSNGTLLKECETFVYKYPRYSSTNTWQQVYVPEQKLVFHYTDDKLIKKEYFYYLEDYSTYYLGEYEIYDYDVNGRVSAVDFYNANTNSILWKYRITYPSANSIQWNWLTSLSGYQDELYFTELYTKQADKFTVNITEFPGQPSAIYYFLDGLIDAGNNITEKHDYYDDHLTPSFTTIIKYDNNVNPLKSVHEFFKNERGELMSDHNPLQIRIDSQNKTSYSQIDYSYEYNKLNYPVKAYAVTTADDKVTSTKKIVFRY